MLHACLSLQDDLRNSYFDKCHTVQSQIYFTYQCPKTRTFFMDSSTNDPKALKLTYGLNYFLLLNYELIYFILKVIKDLY
jgi:hypothetical protein